MVTESIPQFSTDPWIYRVVVVTLGLLALGVVFGGFTLTLFSSKDLPQGVLALGSAAVGGLVGLLVPSPVGRKYTP